ncbi:hypothetical protein DpV83gp027 [Deerpox virus W-848-83]|uniref:Uncharacterized protein n=1 Tax=Deerpox virus (strain Mule deer/United States/W-848-83/1983) TaxID=305674 RepID=Q08FX3_DPV83|nr:hypothetical protein DpV83gp027 [Deerpox virus W-848-83]ABI99184.1 hypothetical protein DpV83gp027 [Deerpox virus W-848-83]
MVNATMTPLTTLSVDNYYYMQINFGTILVFTIFIFVVCILVYLLIYLVDWSLVKDACNRFKTQVLKILSLSKTHFTRLDGVYYTDEREVLGIDVE